MWNVFINNKYTRALSLRMFWCLYCLLWTNFLAFSSLSIVVFEQVNLLWKTAVLNGTEHNTVNTFRGGHRRCSIKKVILENFAILTEKHLCWSLFLIFIERDSTTGVFPLILRNFEEHIFWRTSSNGCFYTFNMLLILFNMFQLDITRAK